MRDDGRSRSDRAALSHRPDSPARRRPTDACRSKRKCRGACSTDFRRPCCNDRSRVTVPAVVVALSHRSPVAPRNRCAPRFCRRARRTFPTSSSRRSRREAAPPAAGALHQARLAVAAGGRSESAERSFTAALKPVTRFLSVRSGPRLRRARAEGLHGSRRALRSRARPPNPRTPRALAGRGEALLTLGQREQALSSFEAAVAADPQSVGAAQPHRRPPLPRAAGRRGCGAEGGGSGGSQTRRRCTSGRLRRRRTAPSCIASWRSSSSANGNLAAALTHAQKAAELNPTEPRNFATLGEIYEAQAEFGKAAEAYATAVALEPSDALEAKLDELREKAAFAAMPDGVPSRSRPRRPSRARSSRRSSACGSTTCSSGRRGRMRS